MSSKLQLPAGVHVRAQETAIIKRRGISQQKHDYPCDCGWGDAADARFSVLRMLRRRVKSLTSVTGAECSPANLSVFKSRPFVSHIS